MCPGESLVKVLGLFFSAVVLKANQVWHAGPTSLNCTVILGNYLTGS